MSRKNRAGFFGRLAAAGLAGVVLWCGGTQASVDAATLKDVFDEHYYADTYKDLKDVYGYDREALWNHYIRNGLAEGRSMSSLINVAKYRQQYADLNAVFGDDWDAYINHYLALGQRKGETAGQEMCLMPWTMLPDTQICVRLTEKMCLRCGSIIRLQGSRKAERLARRK